MDPVRRDDEAVRQERRQTWKDWNAESKQIRFASEQRASYSATNIAHQVDETCGTIRTLYQERGLLTQPGSPESVVSGPGGADAGMGFGTALYSVLESISLSAGNEIIDSAARTAGTTAGLADVDHFVAQVRSVVDSEPVRRAAAREHWREMQLAGLGPDGVIVVEGIADLVYRDDDGSLVIVDYKTDVGVSAETLEAYWTQLAIYAHLLKTAASERVSTLQLVFARAGAPTVLTRQAG
ncbi:PD-(D/E)XK nuclease family protein [Gordonia aurantiaca]|uniref:PD-(D/E)XK nuclease family protein n=1 Tax=Gordonia sp. B21 TaxID=3151852 RepID=UPI0032645B22